MDFDKGFVLSIVDAAAIVGLSVYFNNRLQTIEKNPNINSFVKIKTLEDKIKNQDKQIKLLIKRINNLESSNINKIKVVKKKDIKEKYLEEEELEEEKEDLEEDLEEEEEEEEEDDDDDDILEALRLINSNQ